MIGFLTYNSKREIKHKTKGIWKTKFLNLFFLPSHFVVFIENVSPANTGKDHAWLYKTKESFKDRIIKMSSIIDEVLVISKLQVYLTEIKSLNIKYGKIQIEIELLDTEDHKAKLNEFMFLYNNCLDKILMRIKELHSIKNADSGDSNESSKVNKFGNILLLKVEIKSFDGNPLNLHSFYDTFSFLVHETDELPSVQKFHLLKVSLVGETSPAIDLINVTEENYIVAWKLLKKRYE